MIIRRHPDNRADLKHPQLAVIVEVIRNMCCLSVLPEYFELRKYNLLELCAPEGGIKVVDKLPGAGKSGEIEVTKESGQEQEAGTGQDEDAEGGNSKTVAPDLKEEAKEIKERCDADTAKGENIEEKTGSTVGAPDAVAKPEI
jgi:tRNA acetyltransferase TAN1